jgi:hypothetical protein
VTVTLRGDAAIPLEVTGRFPDGSEHRLTVNLGTVGSEAIKLLWAKERIATLLESDRQAEAIILAKKHNLLCKGAAFIAWDEAEQVQVAQEEIVQPDLKSFALYAACPSRMPRSAGISMQGASFDEPDALFCRASISEVGPDGGRPFLVDLLRKTFQEIGVRKVTVEAWLVWAQHLPGAAETRLTALLEAAALINRIRQELSGPVIERCIQEALNSSAEALLQWANEFRDPLDRIVEFREKLSATQTPRKVIDDLVAWALEPGVPVPDRLEKLGAFADSLGQLPFSSGSKARSWRAFLDSTVGAGSEVSAVANHWIEEAEVQQEKEPGHTAV